MTPKISIIMPVYNGETYLRDAVASIQNQTFTDWEIVFVDDSSTDNSAAIIDAFVSMLPNVRALMQTNAGPAAARNLGISAARAPYLAFLDADDLYPSNKLELQAARLDSDPSLEVVLGRIQYVSLPGAEPLNMRFSEPDNTLIHVHLGGGLFRRDVFEKIGLFDISMRYSEDLDWFLRAYEADTHLLILKAITLHYRLHDANMTHGRTLQEINTFRALKKSLDRRRQYGVIKPLPRWSDFDEAEIERRIERNDHDS